MEIENNLENKAKFFALYYGTKTLNVFNSIRLINYNSLDSTAIRVGYLELTPLSSITDEDTISIYRKVLYNEKHHNYYKLKIDDEIKQGKDCALSCLYLKGGYCGFGAGTGEWICSYLRSKCYALPYMGLSVETMIEYGWIKLKDLK